MEVLEICLLIFSWFLIGFISCCIVYIKDMKGKEYDPNYINGDLWVFILIGTILGYASFIISLFMLLNWKIIRHKLIKLLYGFANPEKKDEDKEK